MPPSPSKLIGLIARMLILTFRRIILVYHILSIYTTNYIYEDVPLVLVPAAQTSFNKQFSFVFSLSTARRWYMQRKNRLIFWWYWYLQHKKNVSYFGGTGTCSTIKMSQT